MAPSPARRPALPNTFRSCTCWRIVALFLVYSCSRDYLHVGPQQARVDNVDIMFIKNHDLSQSTLPVPFELRE